MTGFLVRMSTAVLFGLSVAGCSALGSGGDEARAPGGMFNPGNYTSSVGLAESGPVKRGGRPIAALPAAAGRVVDVREKRLGNGFTQEIVLAAGPGVRGENVIVVYVRDRPHPPEGEPEVEFPKDREDDLATEIEKRFPGGSLQFTDTLLRNSYGPYGVALGRLGGANCVYFWQTLNDLKPYIRTGRMSPYKVETAARVRLCRSGVDSAQLARLAAAIVIDPSGVSEAPALAESSYGGREDSIADALDGRRSGGASRRASYADAYDAPASGGARGPGAVYAGGLGVGGALAFGPSGGSGSDRYAGYTAPVEKSSEAAAQDRPARRVVRYAAAPRRRHVVRYVRVRRQEEVVQTQPAQVYGQAVPAAPAYTAGYAQPGQVVWTQPGAAALAQSAAPAYGGGAAAASAGSVGLPPQAFSGPGAQGWGASAR